jgi:hypothetical protein
MLILDADRQTRRLKNRESEPLLIFSQPDDSVCAVQVRASQVLEFYVRFIVESLKSFPQVSKAELIY